MLAIRLLFLAGQYHANPWDRHVNEADVAWPPDSWRLARALIATWHHKVAHRGAHAPAALARLIDALASEPPLYKLPPASHTHSRHCMPQWKAGVAALVFDAFAAVSRDEPLYMIWPDLDLGGPEIRLLDDLLENLGYLGRAESWVHAQRVEDPPPADCRPGTQGIDPDTGEVRDPVQLLAPLTADAYEAVRERFVQDKNAAKRLADTLPSALVDAVGVEVGELAKRGWSQPPAAKRVDYVRPADSLRPRWQTVPTDRPLADTAVYMLVGKPLPRLEDAVRMGELLRVASCSVGRRLVERGRIAAVPWTITGHDAPSENSHGHAFYLPLGDGAGAIRRLALHVPAGMGAAEHEIAGEIRRLWVDGGTEWRLVLEQLGAGAEGIDEFQAATTWQSITPYLHPWFRKKRFGVEDQVRRECERRGLPAPVELVPLNAIEIGGRQRTPIHFHRFRQKHGLVQPDRHGSLWRIRFDEPVVGPLALGFGCHFGLGLFRPIIGGRGGR